ncbi:MAG: hypothetical protein WC844_05000 [Patescibacteria group bacterium]
MNTRFGEMDHPIPPRTLRPRGYNSSQLGIVVLGLVVIGATWLLIARPWQPKVAVSTDYLLLSFRDVDADTSKGTTMPVTIITLANKSTGKVAALFRGREERTIRVPTEVVKRDDSLPLGTVRWEESKIEGHTYTVVRWRPDAVVPTQQRPSMER